MRNISTCNCVVCPRLSNERYNAQSQGETSVAPVSKAVQSRVLLGWPVATIFATSVRCVPCRPSSLRQSQIVSSQPFGNILSTTIHCYPQYGVVRWPLRIAVAHNCESLDWTEWTPSGSPCRYSLLSIAMSTNAYAPSGHVRTTSPPPDPALLDNALCRYRRRDPQIAVAR